MVSVSGMSDLSHVDESGSVRMVDVGGKPHSRRRATALAIVRMAPETALRLRELPKGDALTTAQLAGIMAAKRTSELIPLCHPLPLSVVDVRLEVGEDAVEIEAAAETTAQTGVEMEALVAATVAALTVYDMAKAIDPGMVLESVRRVVADEREEIAAALVSLAESSRLVLTTGGTGVAPRDVTPEATAAVIEREVPGLAEAIRADSIAKTPHALLSRGIAGVRRAALIVNLPGSTGGCRDGYEILRPALRHGLAL